MFIISCVRVVGRSDEAEVHCLELQDALVDVARFALRAAHRNVLPLAEDLCRVARTNDCGDAELPAHDRRVRRSATVVGDDRGRLLHNRHPVRARRGRDQHAPRHEAVDVVGALDHAGRARRDRIADAQTCHQQRSAPNESVRLHRRGLALRLHRLRPRLHDIERAVVTVSRPLHVHWHAVVFLDHDRPSRQPQDLAVVQHQRLLFLRRRLDRLGLHAVSGVHGLDFLLAHGLVDDRAERRVSQERLEHLVLVRGY